MKLYYRKAIRQHISNEHQLRIQCEKFAEKLNILEEEKNNIKKELVSNIFDFNFFFLETRKKKI